MLNRSISHDSNSSDILPEMVDILSRMASYNKLSDDVILPVSELSQEGLFFTGRKDRVRCFQCGVRIQDWKEGERARDRHREASPNCPLVGDNCQHSPNGGASRYPNTFYHRGSPDDLDPVNDEIVGNNTHLPLSGKDQVVIRTTNDAINVINTTTSSWFTPRDTSAENARSQPTDFTSEANRLASYTTNWPPGALISPRELASAGLFYTGPGDRVQCAWCRGILYNWEPGDTALGEHRRHFPMCRFVKNKLVELVTLPEPTTRESTNSQKDQNTFRYNDESQDNVQTIVKVVQDMGYSKEMVLQALSKIQQNPDIEVTVNSLFDAVFDLEEELYAVGSEHSELSEESQIQVTSNYIQDTESPLTEISHLKEQEEVPHNKLQLDQENLSTGAEKNHSRPKKDHENTEEELCELTEINRHLKDKTLCKVCLNNEIEMVFLPCRHLACCMDCGKAVRHCPVCRTLILGHVSTSLA